MHPRYPYLMMMNERMISLLLVNVLYRYFGFCGKTYQRPADRPQAEGLKKIPENDIKAFALNERSLSAHIRNHPSKGRPPSQKAR